MFIESCMYKSVLGKINKLQKKVFEAILNIFFVLVIVLFAIKYRRISFDHVVIATLF